MTTNITINTSKLSKGKQHHIYIANSFFNLDQVTSVVSVETLLEKHGPISLPEVRKPSFDKNV